MLDADAARWQAASAEMGWQVEPAGIPNLADSSLKSLEARLRGRARVYLAGSDQSAAAVFYLASRLPSLWTAALAVGGSPLPAIETNRLFGKNTQLVPVLWITHNSAAMAERLRAVEFNLETRESATMGEALQWLAQHTRDAVPVTVDCETGNRLFARCYWLEMTGFDPAERNDVLGTTRVPPGSGASLVLQIKPGERVVSIGGTAIRDEADYQHYMDQVKEERPVAVIVERGKERVRVETRLLLPKREEGVTARVQGTWLPDLREVQVLSRTVNQLRLMLPPEWSPAGVNWNGTEFQKLEAPGCWVLTRKKEEGSARKCE